MDKIKATHRDTVDGNEYILHDLPPSTSGGVCVARIVSGAIDYYASIHLSDLEPIPAPPEPVQYDYESWRELYEKHGVALCFKVDDGFIDPCPAFNEDGINGWPWDEMTRRGSISTDYGRTWRKCVRQV